MCGGKPAKKGGEFLRVLTDNYPDDGYKVKRKLVVFSSRGRACPFEAEGSRFEPGWRSCFSKTHPTPDRLRISTEGIRKTRQEQPSAGYEVQTGAAITVRKIPAKSHK